MAVDVVRGEIPGLLTACGEDFGPRTEQPTRSSHRSFPVRAHNQTRFMQSRLSQRGRILLRESPPFRPPVLWGARPRICGRMIARWSHSQGDARWYSQHQLHTEPWLPCSCRGYLCRATSICTRCNDSAFAGCVFAKRRCIFRCVRSCGIQRGVGFSADNVDNHFGSSFQFR